MHIKCTSYAFEGWRGKQTLNRHKVCSIKFSRVGPVYQWLEDIFVAHLNNGNFSILGVYHGFTKWILKKITNYGLNNFKTMILY